MTGFSFVLRSGDIAQRPSDSRFEYRIWPRTSDPDLAALQARWALTGADVRTDIYLVTPISDAVLVRLRDGNRLEVKRRGPDVGTVEDWRLDLSRPFPLSAQERAILADALDLSRDLPAEAARSPAHLLAELDALGETVGMQSLRKSRLLFEVGRCAAEICRVSAGRWRGLTIALKSPDLPSIAAALEDLRPGRLPNRSYGEALLRLLDLRAAARALPLLQ